MNLGPHADFIVAAYAVTIFVVAALLAWILLDYSAQRRNLGELEERGINRRSQRGAATMTACQHNLTKSAAMSLSCCR